MTQPGTDLADSLTDTELYSGDPFPLYARLRSEAPVSFNSTRGFWALARHADVVAVSSDPKTFCSSRGILVDEIGVDYASPPTMMHTDPPAHTRYRRIVQPSFKVSAMRSLENTLKARAKALLETIEHDDEVDVVAKLAVPFPLQVICEMLGVDPEEWERFEKWSDAMIPGATEMSAEDRQALQGETYQFLLDTALQRRASPENDVVSSLATAEIDGEKLSDVELTMFLVQLLVAGNETSRNLISGGLVALAQHPQEWQRLRMRADPHLVPRAVEELLRWTTPVVSFLRTATCDTEIRGVRIAQGDPVLLLYASANRDEEVFGPSAGTLDIGRDPNPHVSFGFATHFCLGAALARLEAQVLLEELASRYARLELSGTVQRTPSPVIAGISSAPMIFTPAA